MTQNGAKKWGFVPSDIKKGTEVQYFCHLTKRNSRNNYGVALATSPGRPR